MVDRGAEREWTFVVFGDDWGRHVSSMQHLFRPLLDRSTVIWIDAIGHREPSLSLTDARRAFQKARAMLARRRGASAVAAVVEESRPAIPAPAPRVHVRPTVLPWHRNPLVRRFNRWSLERDIRRALAAVRADPARVVLVTGSPPSAPVVGRIGERASVYFCMDDFLELPGTTPAMIRPLEQELLSKVDIVVATAAVLVRKKRAASGQGEHLPQGVAYDHFATAHPVPPELASLPRPIIGFAGGVGAAVDVPTLHAIARANAAGSVVLVGPVTLPPEQLDAPNIHILGPRPYAQLPAYVQAFDAGIIPYIENDWTRAVDPLKLLEYLAAGVPVVASPLPEVMKYAHAVRVTPLGEAFAVAAMAAVREGREARAHRQAIAREHTWERRAERFLEIVAETCGERPASVADLAAAS